TDEQMFVQTQGKVEPSTRTQAASEVMGRVVEVSPMFKVGGVFTKNEIMLEIDSSDYKSALASADASLADAKLMLAQEQARAEQAQRDWEKLGRGEPSDLVVRKPQIASAKARIAAAEAAVEKAKRDLDRTKLRAPYDCRVEAVYTDLGSYIMPGARLADLYSKDALELRVPVTLEELGYLNGGEVVGADVKVNANIANKSRQWSGKVVRSEGMVDRTTMTMYLVVGLKQNEQSDVFGLPPAGMFVRASITGDVMKNVFRIPRKALQPNNTLLTMTEENKLRIVSVEVARTLKDSVLVSGGLKNGTYVITSAMETPVPGMKLALDKEQADEDQPIVP
ncbi:MAG: efflux RND transporter periplasmic adaptor subunit, partial [Verrucomicrobiae bacterium]|nr:efflux RND transporter periplasmic adaptor subunit [Verrucomicrobiae bacterium]NNJ85881.1 efflux RND transporter periplasmic adaptor subunit [Akkermansiaceae bacterium]